MQYERILSRDDKPTQKEILKTIGDASLWIELKDYLESSYDNTPELVNYGKYGWTISYRKSGKTLCSLFPEVGAFTVLVVLGKDEAERAVAISKQFNAAVRRLLEDTDQLHDGRWLWVRVRKQSDLKSIRELLKLKKKPKER